MSEDGEARFREPKTVYEERELVKNAIPSSTKYEQMGSNNFWRMENFSVGYSSRFRSRRALLKAMIYTRSHSFLSALKKWMQ